MELVHTFPRLHMGSGRLSHEEDLSHHVLKLRGTLTSCPGTVPALGDLAVLFRGGVLVDFGHKFSFLLFNGDTIEVGDFSGESVLRDTFLSITYTMHHHLYP